MATKVKSFCRNCTGSCGLELEVENNTILSVKGDQDHPVTQGYHCIKAPASVAFSRGEFGRLLTSQKRADTGDFMTIDNAQAMDEIAERLQLLIEQYGPRAVGLFYGTGSYFNGLDWPIMKSFVSELGTPNLFSTMTIDQSARWVSILRLGTMASGTPAPSDVDTLMIVGKNPLVSHQLLGFYRPGKALTEFRRKGGKVILVDPRATETSRHADLHLALKPGEDVVLFAGLIRLILARDWHDKDFCERYTQDLQALREEVEPYSPEVVFQRTGISPEQLEACAQLFCRVPRSLAVVGTGPCMGPHSNLAVHLIDVLNVICGNFLRAGEQKRVKSLLFPRPSVEMAIAPNRTWEVGVQCHSVATGQLFGELPTGALPDEILTPGDNQIRALIVLGGNPVTAFGQPQKTLEAFKSLELLVCIDPRMTETAELAHYVIAPALQYERHDLSTVVDGSGGFSDSFVQYTTPVVEAPPGVIKEGEFFWGLAQRLGLQLVYKKMILGMDYNAIKTGHPLDMQRSPDPEQLVRWWCEGTPVSFLQLQESPSGVMYAPDPADVVRPGPEGSSQYLCLCPADVAAELRGVITETVAENFPFRLIVRRLLETMNSLYVEADSTRRRYPTNYAYMNPNDMLQLGLDAAARVEVRSVTGVIRIQVRADKSIQPGTVAVSHQWGRADGKSQDGLSAALVSLAAESVQTINRMPQQTAIPVSISAV